MESNAAVRSRASLVPGGYERTCIRGTGLRPLLYGAAAFYPRTWLHLIMQQSCGTDGAFCADYALRVRFCGTCFDRK